VVIATGKHVGRADDPRLDTLFLTLPVSWRGTITQYAGRLHRLSDGKREVQIYDYADLAAPMLARMFDRRCRGYEAIGYTVLLPASAIPGWPVDVVLPADLVWKRDYAGSVQRLVRDGVDTPLASLFLHATRTVHADAEGADRARSATEAFLFRRLETLADEGPFRLTSGAIAFGQRRPGRSALRRGARGDRLDGAQHLGCADFFRRDRRKDRLLQENGYLVLRFLAEDGQGPRPRARRHPEGARPAVVIAGAGAIRLKMPRAAGRGESTAWTKQCTARPRFGTPPLRCLRPYPGRPRKVRLVR
jgi:hypothetical protein